MNLKGTPANISDCNSDLCGCKFRTVATSRKAWTVAGHRGKTSQTSMGTTSVGGVHKLLKYQVFNNHSTAQNVDVIMVLFKRFQYWARSLGILVCRIHKKGVKTATHFPHYAAWLFAEAGPTKKNE